MQVVEKTAQATVGLSVELSTQELIVLANLRDKLFKELPEQGSTGIGRTTRIPTELLSKVAVFVGKIAGETQSLGQAETELFVEEIRDEEVAAMETNQYL